MPPPREASTDELMEALRDFFIMLAFLLRLESAEHGKRQKKSQVRASPFLRVRSGEHSASQRQPQARTINLPMDEDNKTKAHFCPTPSSSGRIDRLLWARVDIDHSEDVERQL